MLARLKKQAAELRRKVAGWKRRIDFARNRVEKLTDRIDQLENKVVRFTKRADDARTNGNHANAKRLGKKALDLAAKQGELKGRRRYWIGQVKALRLERQGMAANLRQLNGEIRKLQDESNVKIDVYGNKVTGGTAKDRWLAACKTSAERCGNGSRPNFYSQPGSWTVKKAFTGEARGERSDCSQWVTSIAWTCGLDDPNGGNFVGGGYTGTLLQAHGKWKETDRATFIARGWGYVVYGTGTGFHTEAYIGGSRTIGHGDWQINEGNLDMFGNRRYFIYE